MVQTPLQEIASLEVKKINGLLKKYILTLKGLSFVLLAMVK